MASAAAGRERLSTVAATTHTVQAASSAAPLRRKNFFKISPPLRIGIDKLMRPRRGICRPTRRRLGEIVTEIFLTAGG